MTRAHAGQVPDLVHELAVPLAGPLGVEILEVELGGPKGRPLIRVIADVADPTEDAGLDVEVVAKLSRQLSNALDEHDEVPGPFTLEVTSPGVDRPLTTLRDFQRNVGRDIRLTPADHADAAEVTGRLTAVDGDGLTLEVDGTDVRRAFTDLDHGTIVLPW